MENNIAGPVKVGVQAVGEYLVPGGSNLINGDVKEAGIHALLGFAAGALIGFPGILLVSANSLSKATTGKHLMQHLKVG